MAGRSILVTGGAGMLAKRLRAVLGRDGSVEVHCLDRARLDIASPEMIEQALTALRPEAVINTAAMLVEPCEADPEAAFRVNAWGVRNLARACREHGAALVQISTSGLFGDEVRAYHEYDPVVLKTEYAGSKYAGERYAIDECRQTVVVRLGWLYGGGLDGGRDFVTARLQEARNTGVMQSAGDRHGSPVFADDAARVIENLLRAREWGLYHLANQGGCSRAEYVAAIMGAAGNGVRVEPVDSGAVSAFDRKADVPHCEIMASRNLGYAGIEPLPEWRESLERYVHALKAKGAA